MLALKNEGKTGEKKAKEKKYGKIVKIRGEIRKKSRKKEKWKLEDNFCIKIWNVTNLKNCETVPKVGLFLVSIAARFLASRG